MSSGLSTHARIIAVLAVLAAGGCSDLAIEPDEVAAAVSAVSGGTTASDATYDAVLCIPRIPIAGGTPVGDWDQAYERCDVNATLITPNIVLADIDRIYSQDLLWEYGHYTAIHPSAVPENPIAAGGGFVTAVEMGVGVEPIVDGPDVHRYGVAVYEQRLVTGIQPFCPHPLIDDDPSGNVRVRYYQPDPSQWGEQLRSFYPDTDPQFPISQNLNPTAPDAISCWSITDELTCDFRTDCAWSSTPDGMRCLGPCGVASTEAECSATARCVWAPTPVTMRCIPSNQDAGWWAGVDNFVNTYDEYLERCWVPLAANDARLGGSTAGRIGGYVFIMLSERIEESVVEPMPFTLQYFGGGLSNTALLGIAGDVAGHGDEVGADMRRVALGATVLQNLPPAEAWRNVVRLPNGSDVNVPIFLWGDGGSGAGHLDWAAPWLLSDSSGARHLFAVNVDGILPASGLADFLYATPVTPQTVDSLRAFLDPDGDGIYRGFIDAGPGYIDSDGDGLSEYRIVTGTPGAGGCISYDPGGSQCWRPTGNDNCGPPVPGEPGIYSYSNRDQRDRDGDGIGDVCDVCPAAWDQAQESCAAARDLAPTESPSGRLIRGGDPVGLLCATRLDPTDGDGDGLLDAFCDNCPASRCAVPTDCANVDQADLDHDGIGDVCELPGCGDDRNPGTGGGPPCTEANEGTVCQETESCIAGRCHTDADHDRILDACDNCPPSSCAEPANCANPDQGDDDGDWIGEVCDNCPASLCASPADCRNHNQANCNVDTERAHAPAVAPRGDVCDPTPCPRFALGRVSTSSDIGPGFTASTAGFTGEPLAHASTAGTLRTGFRFCSCDTTADSVNDRLVCAVNDDPEVDPGCVLNDPLLYDDPASKWRAPAALSFPYEVDVDPGPASEAVLRYTPPGPDARRFHTRWEFMTDIMDWGAPFENIGGLIKRARGVVWGHGTAYEPRSTYQWVEGEEDPVILPDEFGCPALATCGAVNRNFTSHHWSGELERLDGLHLPELESVEEIVPLMVSVLPQEICPVCRHAFPIPQLALCPDDLCVRWPEIAEAAPVIDSEMLQVLAGRVEADLLEQLAFGAGMRWVPASEPRERLGSSATYFVGITQNGEVTVAAQLDSEMLVGAAVNATFAQTPAAGSTLLLSGSEHVLYHLAPGEELEWMHLPSQVRASVELSASLGEVQTATLLDEPGARALVIDTLGSAQRIVRIDLHTGEVEVLAVYQSSSRDRHELSTLPDGRVAIVGWKEGVATFAAFILDVTQAGALLEVRAYDGAELMLGSVRGSAEGISFLLADAELEWRPDGVPFEAMDWVDASGQLEQAF